MKQIILLLLLVQFVHASAFTLKEVLASADSNNALAKAIEQERLHLEARNRADTASEPMEIFGTGGKAFPQAGLDNGYEYSAGISKKLYLGDTQEQDQAITRLNNEAMLLEEDQKIIHFENGLRNLYHQHCLDYRAYQSFNQNYQDFARLYKKKEKAYRYQEIAKTELMQLEIEKKRLDAKLREIKTVQEISKQKLLMLAGMGKRDKTALSCSDMYPITEDIALEENSFGLTEEAYQKRLQSTQTALQRYSKAVDSVDLSTQYAKEIDIERYTVGVSIPLAFTSKRSEEERAAAMYKYAAISHRHEQTMLEKKSVFMELRSMLKSNVMTIRSLKANVRDYEKTLLPLMKKRYDIGESSVIEYLLNRQAYNQLKQELFATEKTYYHTLFTLYSLSESKDNQ